MGCVRVKILNFFIQNKMNKQFNLWNKIKKDIDSKTDGPLFKEREIFYLNIGENVGYEENGKGEYFLRPVLIFKKFNAYIFLGIPLTSKIKNNKFYFEFSFLKKTKSFAILSQIKLFSYKRLERKIGVINKDDFQKLKKAFIEIIQ